MSEQAAQGQNGQQAQGANSDGQNQNQNQNGQQSPLGGADPLKAQGLFTEGVPQHLLGDSNEKTLQNLLKENQGFRQAQASKPAPFSKIEDITLDWGEKTKGAGGIASDDKAVDLFKQLAIEHKFSAEQLGAIPAFFEKAIESGLIEPPYDAGKVLEDLAPANFSGTALEKQAKGSERMTTVTNWINQLPDTSGFDKDVKQELMLLTTSAAGVRALELMSKAGMNQTVNAGGNGQQQQGITKADLEKRMADPRYWATDPKFDRAFAEETDALWKQVVK